MSPNAAPPVASKKPRRLVSENECRARIRRAAQHPGQTLMRAHPRQSRIDLQYAPRLGWSSSTLTGYFMIRCDPGIMNNLAVLCYPASTH